MQVSFEHITAGAASHHRQLIVPYFALAVILTIPLHETADALVKRNLWSKRDVSFQVADISKRLEYVAWLKGGEDDFGFAIQVVRDQLDQFH